MPTSITRFFISFTTQRQRHYRVNRISTQYSTLVVQILRIRETYKVQSRNVISQERRKKRERERAKSKSSSVVALSYSRRNHPVSTQQRPPKHRPPTMDDPLPPPQKFPDPVHRRVPFLLPPHSPARVSRPSLFRSTQIRSTGGEEGISPLSPLSPSPPRLSPIARPEWSMGARRAGKAQLRRFRRRLFGFIRSPRWWTIAINDRDLGGIELDALEDREKKLVASHYFFEGRDWVWNTWWKFVNFRDFETTFWVWLIWLTFSRCQMIACDDTYVLSFGIVACLW